MPKPIGFYFDFLSPYGYLGSVGIERIGERTGRGVDWRPMLLGISVLKVMGLPAGPDIPMKGPYAARDWQRTARWMKVPFDPHANTRAKSLSAMRAFAWIQGRDPEQARVFARRLFVAHWADGHDLSETETVASVAAEVGLDADKCLAAIQGDAAKQALRDAVDASLERGVFGCPTFEVGGELFWGVDKLEQVEDWIRTGGW